MVYSFFEITHVLNTKEVTNRTNLLNHNVYKRRNSKEKMKNKNL